MLRATDERLERLMYLRDVVLPHVERMARLGRVDFDQFASPCGTFHCLAGWAACDTHFMNQGFVLRGGRYTRPIYAGLQDLAAVGAFFGLEKRELSRLFGPNYYGDLARRRQLLAEIVERRSRELQPAPAGVK